MAQQNQDQNQNQNASSPFWDFVRSMDNLGIDPNAQRRTQGQTPNPTNPTQAAPDAADFPSFEAEWESRRARPRGPPSIWGPGGPRGDWGQVPMWGFRGPPDHGPFGGGRHAHGAGGRRGRHHRRRRSATPSSSSSRSPSPHGERQADAPQHEEFGPPPFPFGPPPHPHGSHPPHPPHPAHPHHPPHPPHPPHAHFGGGRRGRRGWARGPPPPPFDVNAFLANMASHPIAQNFMQNFMPPANSRAANGNGIDTTGNETGNDENSFTPPLDLFTTPTAYTLHIALPGAKKEDVGIHYSATTNTLTISGVVYRPGSEEFLATMTSSERRVGMFERNVVLKGDNGGEVDADGITAKLEDGVLVVTVPRVEREWEDIKQVDID